MLATQRRNRRKKSAVVSDRYLKRAERKAMECLY
jgi:hypothetical protein